MSEATGVSAANQQLAPPSQFLLPPNQTQSWPPFVPADLKARGLIRSVATTNMNVEALAQLVDAGVPISANQARTGLALPLFAGPCSSSAGRVLLSLWQAGA